MMESSLFSDSQPRFDMIEQLDCPSSTCDTFRVKLFGKLHFLKRLKQVFSGADNGKAFAVDTPFIQYTR